jgi:hypothetical protein
MRELLDHEVLPAEFHAFACGARRSQEFELSERKIPLFEAKEHFHADGTRRANNRYMRLIHGLKGRFFQTGARTITLCRPLATYSFRMNASKGGGFMKIPAQK